MGLSDADIRERGAKAVSSEGGLCKGLKKRDVARDSGVKSAAWTAVMLARCEHTKAIELTNPSQWKRKALPLTPAPTITHHRDGTNKILREKKALPAQADFCAERSSP
jgi:hypothetical protein